MNPKAFYCRQCGKSSDGLTADEVFEVMSRGKNAAYVAARSVQLRRLSSAVGRCVCPDPAPAPVRVAKRRTGIRAYRPAGRPGARWSAAEPVQRVPAPEFHLLGLGKLFVLEQETGKPRRPSKGLWPLFAEWLRDKGC